MKRNIGSIIGLYPTPLAVVGTIVNGNPNYMLVGHLGIIGHDRIMVSLSKTHYSNQGIREMQVLTVSIVDEGMLTKADYVGCVSGSKVNKSEVFKYHAGETGAPVIDETPVVMECVVDDIYDTEGFESFICKIKNVYAEEAVLNGDGKINYHELKPILFEMPTYEYLKTGEVIGKCMSFGKEQKNE